MSTEVIDAGDAGAGRVTPETAERPGMPEPVPAERRPLPLYWRLWKNVPKELAYHLASFPIALTGFVVALTLFSSGLGTLVTFVGIFVAIAALYVSRGFGLTDLVLLEWAGQPAIRRPEWLDARSKTGFWGWFRACVGNGHYWLYLLHTIVVKFLVTLVTWTITVAWTAMAAAIIVPFFWSHITYGENNSLTRWLVALFGDSIDESGLRLAQLAVTLLFALVALATLPLVTRGLIIVHHLVARLMLGAFTSDELARQVTDLTLSRGAAQAAEGHSLRRLERDIHDGPQQRLVRQQMDLAAAERQLDVDPAAARALIASAMEQSREALEELRALSRGFAPPILLDRGLVAALESAAVRSTVSTRVVSALPDHVELPQELERNAYFAASEALANAAKHSGASEIEIRVSIHRNLEADDSWLDVSVTDNGRGGAVPVGGHGLAGLDERLRGLGGILEIASPTGGPTVITAHLPLGSALPSSI